MASLAIQHEGSQTATIVTFSAGVACYKPEQDRAPEDLIIRADSALYRAKELGRNRSICL
jgi:diguanylate cyclase (GGDEF)-like protein